MYFSGNHGWSLPEVLLADSPPCVMLSFWNMSRAVGGFDARSMTRFLSHATGLNLHKPPKGAASFYMKTPNGVQPRFRGEGVPARIGSLFIDSGAHSLYNKEADTGNPRKDAVSQRDKYQFFDLKKGSEFRKFLESYVAFIRKYRKAIDFYVTLDAIYNPEKTWEITCLLEEEYGLKPVPVIHCHAPIKWIAQYIERGHRLIGIGGLGQGITRKAFLSWGDKVFHFLCPSPDKLPVVRTHGFAMTSWKLLMRYPWWSVDSASWIKIAAYGRILVPHRRDGRFVFNVPPYIIGVSQGLLLSLHNLAVYKALLGTNDWREGQDVTEGLGIQKWEAPINAQLAGVARGNFPNFLRKTDQERIQNCWKDVQRHGEEVFEVTQKLDGSSCTIYWNRGDFGVCSRNLDLKSTEDNSFWKIARKYELCGRMERLERNLAIQGELCGPGIQGNPEKLSANDLYVFDIYDIDTGNYLTSEERLDLVATLDLKHVPVIGYSKPGTYGDTVDQFLKAAEGVSLLNNGANKVREGLVFKSTESQFSFKSISNAYLLGEK